jgi:hypothetical protein
VLHLRVSAAWGGTQRECVQVTREQSIACTYVSRASSGGVKETLSPPLPHPTSQFI